MQTELRGCREKRDFWKQREIWRQSLNPQEYRGLLNVAEVGVGSPEQASKMNPTNSHRVLYKVPFNLSLSVPGSCLEKRPSE